MDDTVDPPEEVLAAMKHGLVVDYGDERISCECGWQAWPHHWQDQAAAFDRHYLEAIAARVCRNFDGWTPLGDPPAVDVWHAARAEVRDIFAKALADRG